MTRSPRTSKSGRRSKVAALPQQNVARPKLWFVVALSFTGLLWWVSPGWQRNLALSMAQRALEHRNVWVASQWLAWAPQQPPSASLEFWQARVARKQGMVTECQIHLRQAVSLGLTPAEAEREDVLFQAQTGQIETLQAQLDHWIVTASFDEREFYEALANGLIINYRNDEASSIIDRWKDRFPRDPLPWLLQGRMQEHGQQWDAARDSYLQSLQRKSDYGPVCYNLGRISLGEKRLAEAIAWYRRAIPLLPRPQSAKVALAHGLREEQLFPEARRLLDEVLPVSASQLELSSRDVGDPAESGPVSPWIEKGLLETAERHYAAAVDCFEQARKLAPWNHVLKLHLSTALRGAGRVDQARHYANEVEIARREMAQLTPLMARVRNEPHNADLKAQIGTLCLAHFSESQGEMWLKGALRSDANCLLAHETLARHYANHRSQDPALRKQAEFHQRHIAHIKARSASSQIQPSPGTATSEVAP